MNCRSKKPTGVTQSRCRTRTLWAVRAIMEGFNYDYLFLPVDIPNCGRIHFFETDEEGAQAEEQATLRTAKPPRYPENAISRLSPFEHHLTAKNMKTHRPHLSETEITVWIMAAILFAFIILAGWLFWMKFAQ